MFTPVTVRRRSAAQGCADAQHSPRKAASSRRVNGARSHEQLVSSRASQKHYCEAAPLLARAQQQPRQQQQEEKVEAAAEADELCGVREMPMPVSSVLMCIEHAQFL